MCIWISQSDSSQGSSSICYAQHHEVRENTRSVGQLLLAMFKKNQNSISQSWFETEEPSPHTRPAKDIRTFWRLPRTGTKCITSSAASPSRLPVLKETVNVAAKSVSTSQSDRWPIVSCWNYASTLPVLGMTPFIRLRSFLCSRRSITVGKPSPTSVNFLCIGTGVIYLADLFNQAHLNLARKHSATQPLMREGCSYT